MIKYEQTMTVCVDLFAFIAVCITKKNTKTTYTEVNSNSIFLFYAVKIYDKVM